MKQALEIGLAFIILMLLTAAVSCATTFLRGRR
jgi:hypothetical protein